MGSLATGFALAANAALPAFTTYKYAQYALAPGAFDDAHSEALATLFIAQIPLCILGAVFAGVAYGRGAGVATPARLRRRRRDRRGDLRAIR